VNTPLPSKIVLITPNFENNSLGRTYCLWMLAKELNIAVEIHGVKGTQLWSPLADSEFARDCVVPSGTDHESVVLSAVKSADLTVAVKPLPSSFGLALRLTQSCGSPLLLDIDDPDIEVRTILLPWFERLGRFILSSRYRELRRLGRRTTTVPRMVSNPVLQQRYGGVIVPHVRARVEIPPTYSSSTSPVVRFIGSPRGHKGLAELRIAMAPLANEGFTLEVTADAPDDARASESWLGQTTLAEGNELVASSDIIAIPSLANSWSPAQLPAKLVDAMMNGRAIVASSMPPIVWALGADSGLLLPPGDVHQLRAALRTLSDPIERQRLGEDARRRAEAMFSVEAVAPLFATAVSSAWHSADAEIAQTTRAHENGAHNA
jgi:glycosyltransferase involved in cell wall biosynthesis